MVAVLFVCTANICRSPMAMGLFREKVKLDSVMSTWRIESAGTWARDGQRPFDLSVQVMARRGIDIEKHRSRRVTASLLKQFDLVLTMEEEHRDYILGNFPEANGRVFLLSSMAGVECDIEDPFGGTEQEVEASADQIEQILSTGFDEILRRVRTAHLRT